MGTTRYVNIKQQRADADAVRDNNKLLPDHAMYVRLFAALVAAWCVCVCVCALFNCIVCVYGVTSTVRVCVCVIMLCTVLCVWASACVRVFGQVRACVRLGKCVRACVRACASSLSAGWLVILKM